ncbi:hypothetical protein BKA82DRAFT_1008161 [Pisolithus tinctorius]|uniref:Uncharacterized protein n=1 Tax=Pisolithus tinctorius Marx 270 TaxID=870435 RepID=A0A0C3IC89_PISTI|nr:hypothetical protein BKA82DRAFT_1008161 [Pisolithus tinctorius]KIN94687.1 hypothetical protein M404DRAFT_1008161 [Pisolithus tinctorius Marx 270]
MQCLKIYSAFVCSSSLSLSPPSLSIFIYSIVVHLSRRSKQVLTSLSILVLLSIAELVNTYHLQPNTYCNAKCIPQVSDQGLHGRPDLDGQCIMSSDGESVNRYSESNHEELRCGPGMATRSL